MRQKFNVTTGDLITYNFITELFILVVLVIGCERFVEAQCLYFLQNGQFGPFFKLRACGEDLPVILTSHDASDKDKDGLIVRIDQCVRGLPLNINAQSVNPAKHNKIGILGFRLTDTREVSGG